jgi:hypothetical protein
VVLDDLRGHPARSSAWEREREREREGGREREREREGGRERFKVGRVDVSPVCRFSMRKWYTCIQVIKIWQNKGFVLFYLSYPRLFSPCLTV